MTINKCSDTIAVGFEGAIRPAVKIAYPHLKIPTTPPQTQYAAQKKSVAFYLHLMLLHTNTICLYLMENEK